MQITLNNAAFRDQTITGTFPLLKEIQPSAKEGYEFMTRILYNGLRARVFFNRKDYKLLDDAVPVAVAAPTKAHPVQVAATRISVPGRRTRGRGNLREVPKVPVPGTPEAAPVPKNGDPAVVILDTIIQALTKLKAEMS
ncbi:hypothetical protein [Ralstonia phage RSP15]|uniref:hypothetical protein n=1 Tax=Ralstonia phage RSP15 TaxID=1785960 RepID=UPI00074D3F17|nr:hypothetical protein BH754_gp169 [Ralstonia phage RSP15]BAU40137.1 hypothetical protein [Ralstonia phage RSP15]